MIKSLELTNVALIDKATIEFGKGLNVLTGETGSGKSVILDAINFVLGAKADKSMIRHGEAACFATAVFDISENASVKKLLDEYGAETDDELIVNRKFTFDGKSAIRVNGEPYSASMLKSLTGYLIDVHGQSEHYSLLKVSEQLKILDKFCKGELENAKRDCSRLCGELKGVDKELGKFGGSESERAIKADILKFQIDEIEKAGFTENEEEELLIKRKKIQSAEKLAEAFSSSRGALSEENCALDMLNSSIRALSAITNLDEKYLTLYERLKAACAEVEDISETIDELSDDCYFDESEADEVENRLETIKTLKKKYGANFEEINNFLVNAITEYDKLINFDAEYAKLAEKKNKLLLELNKSLKTISEIRKKHSVEFCQKVTAQLHELGMKRATFEIEFKDRAEISAAPYPENGNDEIEFEFSANLGEPVKSLSKIISGGEMSRFMLALKTIISEYQDISTYVFDEIDVGISGATAETVAKKFADISKSIQVIAISHLPQVSAMSDCALKISKVERDEKTFTIVEKLDKKEKIAEIARIMGGENASSIVMKHAEEMVAASDEYKK